MRGLRYAVGGIFVLVVVVAVAYWEGARVQVSIVKFSSPPGFCPFDRANGVDAGYLDAMANFAKVGGFAIAAAYADCAELAEARKSGAFIPTRVGIFRWLRKTDRPSPQFISEACDHVRKTGLPEDQKALLSRYITEFSNGKSSLKNILPLGVLEEVKGTVCYDAKLMKASVAGNDVAVVDMGAMTTVGNQPIAIHQWTNYRDESSVAAALASLKQIYSDFAGLNGTAN